MHLDKIFIQPITDSLFTKNNIELDILRLDVIHKTVSGNKSFKLKYYLEDAKQKGYRGIVTYGGAYSNHIIASAYACKEYGFKSSGIIRGEEPKTFSHTLLHAKALGMELHFVDRQNFRNKNILKVWGNDFYEIPEGGFGILGAKGCSEILLCINNLSQYHHIICATGTGTMLAGIVQAALPQQHCTGISVMKNNFSLHNEVLSLLPDGFGNKNFTILHEYHFGGYAKYNNELLSFINESWHRHTLPLDFVYTAKTFFAVQKLAEKKYFSNGCKILMIHSGGLQGNLSLPAGILSFL